MKNREKYAEEILNVACTGENIAVDKRIMQVRSCEGFLCEHCLFSVYNDCDTKLAEWAESEYIELAKISKRDRAFLDYIKDIYRYIARDEKGDLCIYVEKPKKRQGPSANRWICHGKFKDITWTTIELPMIKWSDAEPWMIEDLKKLEVCDEY